MSKIMTVRPGRFQSAIGFFMGCVFCIVGVFIVIQGTAGFFGIIWTLFAVLITVANGINAFTKKQISSQTVEVEDELEDTDLSNFYTESEVEERLIRLKSLYDQNLITESEYATKKQEILKHL